MKDYNYYFTLAETAYNYNNYTKAIEYYNKCLEFDQEIHYSIYQKLGNSYFHTNNLQLAHVYQQKCLEKTGWFNDYKFYRNYFYLRIHIWKGFFNDKNFNNLNYLEIGSYEGMSALWLKERYKDLNITCIDTSFQENYYDNIKGTDIKTFKGNIEDFVDTNTETFDLIYVDGEHTDSSLFKDCYLSFKLLNENGYMIIDGYKLNLYSNNCRWGIDKFLNLVPNQYKIITQDSQLIIQKLVK